MKRQPSTTVLGLTIDGGILTAVELKRANGSARVLKHTRAHLTLDPLRDEPELAGREIRNLLNQAQISTKRCIAGVPANWALTLHCKVPQIEQADLQDFLHLEAERNFACNVDELQISSRVFEDGNGTRSASIIGVPRSYLERLEAVLIAAQLKPISLSIGIAALPNALQDAATLEINEGRLDLLVAGNAGVVALRTIDGAFDTEGAERRIQTDVLGRELRITLAQVPEEIRRSIRELNVFGESRLAAQLLSDFGSRAGALGLDPKHVTRYPAQHHGMAIDGEVPVNSALSLAALHLSGAPNIFEFLPPKPTFWEELSSRYASRRLAYAGAAAVILLLLAGSAFGYQQAQFSRYQTEWAGMKAKVSELEAIQQKVRRFRAWHDTNVTTLQILRRLTEAFPEEGTVSAKIIEIRNVGGVSCIGTARDNASLLKTIDQLRNYEQVRDLRVDQIRGVSPLQFTFNFQWKEGPAHEN